MKKYVDWDKIEEETVSAEEACECTRSKLQSWIDFVVDLFLKKKESSCCEEMNQEERANAMITDTAKKIITSICPTCGCSLIRLGIGSDRWTTTTYEGKEYFFCCQGCTDLFNEEPPKYLEETKDLVVCPTCLAEKPVQWAVRMEIAGWEAFFCRCPYCPEVFAKDPDQYVKRLQGEIPYDGVFGQAGCCSSD